MNHYSSQIILLLHNILHVSCTHIHIEGRIIINFTIRWIRNKIISFKVVNNVTTPTYFVFKYVKKKKIVAFILALQMTQTPFFWKIRLKSFLMLVILTFHQAWPSCFLSIPCIWPNWPSKLTINGYSNKTSPLDEVGMQWTFSMQNLL